MKNKKPIKKVNKIAILSAVICTIAVFVAVIFIYMPFLDKSKYLRERILYERDRNIVIGKIRALGRHLKAYEKRMPDYVDVSWLLGAVSDIAGTAKIQVSSIEPGRPERIGMHTKINVVMEALCTYDQLGKFFSLIESSEIFMRIDSVDVKRLDLEDGFDKENSVFKGFDNKADIVISTVILTQIAP